MSSLPVSVDNDNDAPLDWATLTRPEKELDSIGALVVSTSSALLSQVLAVVADSDPSSHMRSSPNIVFLVVGLALIPGYIFWVRRQTGCRRPASIPCALWKSEQFTSVCVTVFLVWGAVNASEKITCMALYLQDVRIHSNFTSYLHFLQHQSAAFPHKSRSCALTPQHEGLPRTLCL